jgi:hypothetical protein
MVLVLAPLRSAEHPCCAQASSPAPSSGQVNKKNYHEDHLWAMPPSQVQMAIRLCYAARSGNVQDVKLLLEHQTSPDLREGNGKCPNTQRNALHEACSNEQNDQIVALLLEHSADVNLTAKRNSKVMNAYEMALHKGCHATAQRIVDFVARNLPDGAVLENILRRRRPQKDWFSMFIYY